MSGKLTNGQRHQLERWIGTGAKYFHLLYSITRDGCNSQTFHTKCDNQGPTVTVLYNPSGSVYGGYTAMDWDSSGEWVSDTAAFLFRLQYNGSDTFNKFPVKCMKHGYAMYDDSSYGPTFGGGNDRNTFTGAPSNPRGYNERHGQAMYDDDSSYGLTFGGGNDRNTFTGAPSNPRGYNERHGQAMYDDDSSYGLTFGGGNDRNTFTGAPSNPRGYNERHGQAMYDDDSSYGLTFGGGHDLNTFTGTINNSRGYYTLNGSQNYGYTYDIQGVTAAQINNGNTNVTELEVYTVQVAKTKQKDNEIWRKTPKWTSMLLESLRSEIESHSPTRELSLPRFNVLLIGPVGAGKSSFFNTVTSVFRGYVTFQARSGSTEQSLTSTYRMYDIRSSTSGRPLNCTLCDTRGLEEAQGLDAHEVTYILGGNVPNKYTFNPSKPISEDTPGFIKKPTEREKIHCVCFIVDGTSVEIIPEKVKEKMKAIQTHVNHRDIPQLVLLTKVDRICERVQADLSTIFSNTKVKDAVDKASQVFGIPRAQVLPVKNYESETDLDENVSILTLLALRQILRSCQDYLYNQVEDLEDRMTSLGAKE